MASYRLMFCTHFMKMDLDVYSSGRQSLRLVADPDQAVHDVGGFLQFTEGGELADDIGPVEGSGLPESDFTGDLS